jgi:hypothetical protein
MIPISYTGSRGVNPFSKGRIAARPYHESLLTFIKALLIILNELRRSDTHQIDVISP